MQCSYLSFLAFHSWRETVNINQVPPPPPAVSTSEWRPLDFAFFMSSELSLFFRGKQKANKKGTSCWYWFTDNIYIYKEALFSFQSANLKTTPHAKDELLFCWSWGGSLSSFHFPPPHCDAKECKLGMAATVPKGRLLFGWVGKNIAFSQY